MTAASDPANHGGVVALLAESAPAETMHSMHLGKIPVAFQPSVLPCTIAL
jgi:hypothetical protein